MAEIHTFSMALKQTLAQATLASLMALRERLAVLVLHKAKATLIKCRSHFLEHSNKCVRMLARALESRRTQSYITEIKGEVRTPQTYTESIAETFRSYYEDLHNLNLGRDSRPSPLITDKVSVQLQALGLPQLSDSVARALDSPLTGEEVEAAIKSSANGKLRGPDGLTLAYYKTLADTNSTFSLSL